ncbi:MAG: hypothetical protein ACLTXT_08650, partial [Ruminococcus callidus]
PIQEITDIRGTCYLTSPENTPWGGVQCPDYAQVCRDKKAYAKATRQQYDQQDEITGKTVLQRHGDKMLVQNPPAISLTQEELDAVYRLPYQRKPHPMYDAQGGVPGIEEVQFSIAHNRGCFGYCNFCSIALHQGRRITCRSEESILEEAKKITEMPNFKGYIHDVGGPTANFRLPSCKSRQKPGCAGEKVSCSGTLQGVAGGSQRVSPHSPEAAETPQGEAGVYPFRYPVRLCHGGQGRHLLQGTGGRARQRAAESGSGACEQRGAGQNGQAPYRVLRSVPEAVL